MRILSLLIALTLSLSAFAGGYEVTGSRKAVGVSGDVITVAMPLATLTGVLIERDWTGLKQAAFTTATTLGATYILKYSLMKITNVIIVRFVSLSEYFVTHNFIPG